MRIRITPTLIFIGLAIGAGCTTAPELATPIPTGVPTSRRDVIHGVVFDEYGGTVVGATVRVQATELETITDAQGRFTLTSLMPGETVTISAWKHNYYCAKIEGIVPPDHNVSITLRLYQRNDNPDYLWIPPVGESSCASCKPGVTQIWLDNAHAGASTNPRFLTMYNGTDVEGNHSPFTRFGYNRDYGSFPMRPDPNQPYYGPGYKLDFPNTTGNCAACHTPGAAIEAPYDTDPNNVNGADNYGVHCDFCHKIADVTLDPNNGLPFVNMPGVLSMDIRRPFSEDPERYQLFFGTFDDDNVPEEDTYLPLIETSQFCASCHYGVFWDTVIYNSFGEWLDSPYSDPSTGKTCQNCHMPSPSWLEGAVMSNVAPDTGGVERDPMTIHAHLQRGALDEEFLKNALTMVGTASWEGERVIVEIQVTNDNTGHHIPTDSPLRHLLLIIQATDEEGNALMQIDGPKVPEWGGIGDPELRYYAGLPGKGYAKILQELWTEIYPTGAYWNQTRVVMDNRVPAFETDTSIYSFSAPSEGVVQIEIRLIYRRAFIQLMDWKGWVTPDIIMAAQSINLSNDE